MSSSPQVAKDRPSTADLTRSRSPYSLTERARRAIWALIGQPLFAITFHNWYLIRRLILRAFGAQVARSCRIRPTVRIEQPWNLTIGPNSSVGDYCILYCLGPITIGENVTISQYAHLCAGSHDSRSPAMQLVRPPIIVQDEVWIAADAFVGPGVTIAKGCIVGARAAVFRNTNPWTIYLGNPAIAVKPRDWSDHR
jgi:putative colanic acid biosynthesis acetyltransferase WcaF